MKPYGRNFILSFAGALLPAVIGLGIYVVLHTWFSPVPLLVFRADIGSALAVTGVTVSVILLSGVAGWTKNIQHSANQLAEMHRAQEDSRRRFIRRLDHELKNPLTGLRAALANLSEHNGVTRTDVERSLDETAPSHSLKARVVRDVPRAPGDASRLPSDAARSLYDAEYQTARLSRLVADLRKLAELEERPLESAPVDLAEVLEETVEAVSGLPHYAGRRVNMIISRVPWPLPPIKGDRDLLGLAFYNLLENALKYSGPGDTVEVRAVEDGRWLTVEVADTGPGISGEDLPRVFEELYRGTNARGLEGSGLGLSLVRRVIDRHGGEINVRSRQSGQKGTVFRVRLPAAR